MAPLKHNYHVKLNDEGDGALWAEVIELPGCFASGSDLAELKEAVTEAIELYTSTATRRNHIRSARWRRLDAAGSRFSVTLNAPSRTGSTLVRKTTTRVGRIAALGRAVAR